MYTQLRSDRRGIALITSLAIVLVVSVLILGSILTTQVELFVTSNDSTSAQAQYVAQAGLQTYKTALFQNFRWMQGGSGGQSLADACANSLSGGIDFNRTGSSFTWVNNQIVVPQGVVRESYPSGTIIGTFDVTILRDPNNNSRFTVRSIGRTTAGGQTRVATSTARATFVIRNSSTLEQAIFAGQGSGMRFINGNTRIYGGVYIVGTSPPNDPELVWQSNGNLGVYNGYDKRNESGTLGQFLAAEAHQSANLCAAVRVQNGRIALGGSSQLGTQAQPLLTVAVGRGLQDVDVSQGGTLECTNNKGVCVESPVGPFDIANPPLFPMLDEPPGTEFCPSPSLWRTCIRVEAALDGMTITNSGSAATRSIPSGATLPSGSATCQAFLNAAAASTSRTITFADTSYDCTYTLNGVTHGFRYIASGSGNGATGVFETFGNLNFRGFDIAFDQPTTYRANSRSSTGGNQRFANLSIESIPLIGGGSFQAGDNFVSNSAHGVFPNNVLSIVAEDTVRLRGGNSTYVTAPIYAGNQMQIRSSTQLFGQVIANQFCTTSNQPTCGAAGSPAEIIFVPTGENRARSFRAIAPTGGLPTFRVEAYEMR